MSEGRGEATENGGATESSTEPQKTAATEDASEPTEQEKPKKKLKITNAKFSEPSEDEYKKAQKLSQRSDGSRSPQVPGQGGAPPSADNLV